MGLLDKLLGRGKKAAGDVMGSMRREGAAQESQGAPQHEQMSQEQRDQAAEARTERET